MLGRVPAINHLLSVTQHRSSGLINSHITAALMTKGVPHYFLICTQTVSDLAAHLCIQDCSDCTMMTSPWWHHAGLLCYIRAVASRFECFSYRAENPNPSLFNNIRSGWFVVWWMCTKMDVFLINHVNKLNLLLKLMFSNVLCIISWHHYYCSCSSFCCCSFSIIPGKW